MWKRELSKIKSYDLIVAEEENTDASSWFSFGEDQHKRDDEGTEDVTCWTCGSEVAPRVLASIARETQPSYGLH
jgi:hypothetical protein